MKKILLTTLLLVSYIAFSQTAIGEFTAHPALHSFFSVTCDDEFAYAASQNAVMMLEKSTALSDKPALSFWSKVEGLSDIDIVKIYYSKEAKTLIIAYENGNLDFIRDGKLINVRDIKDKSISASKSLQMCRSDANNAFLVYPFGIVIVDLEQLTIADTWFTKRDNKQFVPTDITQDSENWYISTTEGIYSKSKNTAILADFSNWNLETEMPASFLACVDNKIFACKHSYENSEENDTIFTKTDDNQWIATEKNYTLVNDVKSYGNNLMICDWSAVEVLDSQLNRISLSYWMNAQIYPDAREAVLDNDNIWIADAEYGLVMYNLTYYLAKFYKYDSPYTDYVERMSSKNGLMLAVHGTRKGSSSYAPGYKFPALSSYKNRTWSFNSYDFLNYDTVHMTFDLTDVAINPDDETEAYVASWGNGLFKCKNNRVVAHYNAYNSPLDSTDDGKTFVSGLQFDNQGNLWMTNSQCSNMLKVLTKDGKWYSFNIGTGVIVSSPDGVMAENLLIDSRGYKWVNFPRDATVNYYGLVAYNDNKTLDNKGDDRFVRIDMNRAAEVNSSRVFCIAEDLDGEIWIGTDKGVKVIYSPSRIFEGNVYPRNILLEQDGYVSVLLEYEDVTAIAVDGANRKWIGTGKAGVFLMSENGQEELLHFTADDNPLFADQIVSIHIDQFTGEVYFATSKGLVSYKSTATQGFESYSDLLVYPNPVPHNYSGVVAVKGLKSKSLCKITDSFGKLVWQGYSDGGQLVWDCKDYFGNRPATGVYYVMISDEDGKDKVVAKFVFIN